MSDYYSVPGLRTRLVEVIAERDALAAELAEAKRQRDIANDQLAKILDGSTVVLAERDALAAELAEAKALYSRHAIRVTEAQRDAVWAECDALAAELAEAKRQRDEARASLASQRGNPVTYKSQLKAAFKTISALQAELAEAKHKQVSGFYEEQYPHYKQGEPHHELQQLVTAEECNGLVSKIKTLRTALERVVTEGKVYAAHNALEPCAQRMYDHAEEALRGTERTADQPMAAQTNDAKACLAEAAKYPDGSDTRMVLLQASTRIEYLERLLDRAQRPTTDEMQRAVGHTDQTEIAHGK